MNAQRHLQTPTVRVLVCARDPARHRELAGMVHEGGLTIVATLAEADAVLADVPSDAAECDSTELPVLALVESDGAPGELDVAGVLPRAASRTQIMAALRAVASGLWVRSHAPRSAPSFRDPDDERPATPLTPREIEILSAVGDGLSNKAVARMLGISAHTVKFHLEAIFDKLDAATRAEAVAKGLRRGLIEV